MKEWYEVWPERATATKQVKRGLTQEEKTEVWIYRAKQVHGDKYDYSKFTVEKTTDKSVVICPVHGEFEISPSKHITAGLKCPHCSTATKPLGNDGFITKARAVHGNKYDYSLVKYVNNRTNVDIVCSTHGIFSQTPDTHLVGSGCAGCKGDLIRGLKRKTQADFEEEIYTRYGDEISVVGRYETAHIKIEFKCKKHGKFTTDPHSILRGSGCAVCSRMGTFDQIYLIHINKDMYKIGVTASLDRRIAAHRSNFGPNISLIKSVKPSTLDAYEIEQYLLTKYQNKVQGLESLEGYTEVRILDKSEVDEICSFLETI